MRCIPNTPSSVGRGALRDAGGAHLGGAARAGQGGSRHGGHRRGGSRAPDPRGHRRLRLGPAYVFYLAEAMRQAGEAGPGPGAGARARQDGLGGDSACSPRTTPSAALRRAITSPGRHRLQQAITTFDEKGLRDIVAAGRRPPRPRATRWRRSTTGSDAPSTPTPRPQGGTAMSTFGVRRSSS
ncbi:hypothetical protein QJS66_18865 [Kocuria rhizophila]|nr:hypothetical protein QJS66_18865 [Kocuria rhizophila]